MIFFTISKCFNLYDLILSEYCMKIEHVLSLTHCMFLLVILRYVKKNALFFFFFLLIVTSRNDDVFPKDFSR